MTDELKNPNPTPLTAEQIAAATGGRVLSDEESAALDATAPAPVTAPTVTKPAPLSLNPEEQALQARLKQGSGEDDLGGGWTFIPYITVDNRNVEYTLHNGQKVAGRCQPNFVVTEKEDEAYKTTLFLPEFKGAIIKFMNKVKRKAIMDQSVPPKILNKHNYYQSLEFKSFKSQIFIRQKNGEGKMQFVKPMTYNDIKATFGDENELWGVVYFLMVDPATGQLEDTVRKAEFKGMSRSVMYDYMTARRDYSVSSIITHFKAELKKDTGNPYNCLALVNTGIKPDPLLKVVEAQEELNRMIDGNLEPTLDVEQLPAPEVLPVKSEAKEIEDTEIKVQGIPF